MYVPTFSVAYILYLVLNIIVTETDFKQIANLSILDRFRLNLHQFLSYHVLERLDGELVVKQESFFIVTLGS